jgi:lysophospholipase L1-like esterase
MRERYTRTLADDPTSTWTFTYTPDVIVIALGTNDFANGGDPGQLFRDRYIAFVQMLRARFAQTSVVLATSPMVSGGDRTTLHTHLDAIAAALADPRVAVVDIAEQLATDGYGCGFHPNEVTAHKMADTVVPAIRSLTGW